MGELSFLTIIVSLAVCSLLVYAAFQYTKVRLTILEQSHKEQAMILQQFIEESSTDIHRLYQISSSANGGAPIQTNGSIILEYANNDRPVAYNEPHMIHLDTAFFQNKRNSNLIEISSDSEDTTDASSSSSSDDEGDDECDAKSRSSDDDDDDDEITIIEVEKVHEGNDVGSVAVTNNNSEDAIVPLIAEITPPPEIKVVTVDLGISEELEQEQEQEVAPIEDSLSMLSISSQEPADELVADFHVSTDSTVNTQLFASSSSSSLSSMSVPDLKHMLKEKYKNQPEKHAEIQKLKKAELIAALQLIQ